VIFVSLLVRPLARFAVLAIFLALHAALSSPAAAGSLDDYLRASRGHPAKGLTVEEALTAINNYSAALDADEHDEQLTTQQRKSALYQRAYHWMTLYRCNEAIPGFTQLIDGTDARVGELSEDDPIYAESFKWRAVCRYTVMDLNGAIADIAAARRLQPNDYTIRRMDMEMTLSNLPLDG
jgi:hypothetical protein